MQPINERRSTNQFLICGTTVEQIGRIAASITEEFPGWRIVAIGQDKAEVAADWHTFGARISKSGQGLVDIQVELRGDVRVTKANWVRDWHGAEDEREPITDLEKALAHEEG